MGRRLAAAVLAGLLLAILPVAGPARAHDGKLKLEVAGDGATGVTVQAVHADGHRLDTVVRLVLSATAEGGRTVGPVQLAPSGEGQGFYSSGPILAPGTWKVTVQAPAPNTTKVTVEVRARAAQTAPASVAQDRAEPSSRWPLALGVLAAVAVVALLLLAVIRRRAPVG
ncbi:hypothetical protein AB0M54_23820 [Actinoplanes sp. NPDC051470]|uniref:hypothetical protein n=1 Tax=Actinoplanes sp. NPDC051470 TaxID=3157224 RepID=UPI003422B38A